jgi:2-phospho-L-lactate guanylyltransferase
VRAAVLVPVKDFRLAKGRLAPVLGPEARALLARRMADLVLAAARPLERFVVCDDDQVAAWAEASGAVVLWRPGHGLNGAVSDAVATLGRAGFEWVVVAHSDLPLASSLASLVWPAGVTLVPDRRDDGTNVAVVPSSVGFRFAYGTGSFRRHAAEARRLGLPVRVVRDRALGWDVDLPVDLDHPLLQEVLSSTPTSPDSPLCLPPS